MADNSDMSAPTGPFIALIQITAKPGKAEELSEHLAKIRAYAESDKEPDTLTFRPARGCGGNPDKFIIFEKYLSKEAADHHRLNPALADFIKADVGIIDKVEVFDEIGAFESS